MASWYKGLLTNASSNISKLQRTYFGGESDGDTEDDTHVCRVLRGYYAEKGQPLPSWLPPDPKAPPPPQPVFANQGSGGGSRYGSSTGAAGGGLSSLWGDSNSNGAGQQAQAQRPGPFVNSRNPFAGGGDAGQRAGSYQAAGSGGPGRVSPAPSGSSGVSAQEKLKQRLWGGSRTTSPSSGGPFQPPGQQQQPPPAQPSANRWAWSGQGGAGGSDGLPGTRHTERSVMSANAPWSSDGGSSYSSSGAGGVGGQGGGRSYGLPSGPRSGLPSGPRPR
ncbi:Sec1-binding region of Mso1-domain-containing protein [Thermothelomyces heterothallicus CBS 202.75]|uniref:Sec1-binding region of Mso1-domain-containing protein n=1 Tax=Thermothelomyces heterothallicus CBS 202.75 TaxID=1149848 RepID=UPI0037421588